MDQATINKIRGHKFGQRKLATVSALARMNKTLKTAGADLAAVIAADQGIISRVAAMNAALTQFFGAVGLAAAIGGQGVIEVDEITSGNIPTATWLGYIDFPVGTQTGAARATCHTAELAFADQAGQLRSRLASIVAAVGVLNDLGNSAQKPNRGGEVGDPAHRHAAHA